MPPSAEVVVEVILTADRRTHGARGSTTADEGDDIDVVAGNRLSLTTHSSPLQPPFLTKADTARHTTSTTN